MSFQKYLCHGNLTREPEVVTGDKARANFGIAVNGYKDSVIFFNCTAWGKLAENVVPNLHKGSRVQLEAELISNEWTDGEGNPKSSVDLNVRGITYLDKKSAAVPASEDIPF
jgi:single-strand DNA-binding protein